MLKTLRILPLLGGLLLASCGDDNGGNEPNPSIAVSLGGAITVVQGQTGSTQVTVTRAGGFSGSVALTATGLPTGVTAAFDPATVPAGTGNGTSTLTLTAAANAATGAATFNVAANGGANLTATTNGSVTVDPAPDFTLAVAPTTLSVQQGANGTANVTITRTGGFTGAVNLTVANLPTGVTAAFDNAAPTGTAAVLTLTVGAGAATGTTNLTINGVGTPGTRSAALALTVTAPPSGFTLAANPSTVSIVQGVNGQSTITVSKTGTFTGPVALSLTGAPANVTATFNPTSATAPEGAQDVQTTSTLTLTVGAGVTAQNYPLVIHGQAEGQPEATTNLTLTVTAAPVNGFTIAINPTTVTAQAGATGQTTVTITKTGTFNSNVTLSVPNLPTGVTAAFNPAAASAGKSADVATTSTLTLTVAATVAPQNYNLTVRGTFTDFPVSDVPLTLTVTPAPGDYSLSVNPTSVSVQAGQSGTATVTISKTGSFTGNVTLSAVGLPANVTASFNPAAASPPRVSATRDVQTTSTMTLTVGAGVTPNNYAFQIKGVAEGKEDKLLATSVTVAAPPGPGNGNLKFCDLDNLPIWFAYQDGNGPWTQVTGSVAGDGTTYTFNITQSTGAFSYVSGNATDGFITTVFFGTQAQLIGNVGQCVSPNAGRTLTGSVAGIGATDQVVIAMGGGGANASTATPSFQLKNVLNGASDLIAVRNSFTLVPVPALTPLGIIIRRGLNIADGGTIPVLDFGAAEAFAPQTAQVTLGNLGTDTPIVTLSYQATTTLASLSTSLSGGTAHTVYGIPAAQQIGSDLHQLTALAASGQAGDGRGHFMWFKTLADKTVTLGPVLTLPTIASLGNTPYPRYSTSGPIQAEYDDGFSFVATQAPGGSGRSWSITGTRGYFAGATYTLLMPDMSAAGYQALWALQVASEASLITSAFGFSGNGFTPPQVEGGFGDFANKVDKRTP